MKKIFITLSFLVVVLVAVPFSVEAQQTPEPQAKLTDAEKQVMLAQIVQQIGEVQYELLRLSLVVAKLELEEQALALQTQLEERRAEEARSIAMVEPPAAEIIESEDSSDVRPEDSVPRESERPGSPEDIFSAVSLERESTSTATTSPGVGGGKGEEDEEDKEDKGFLAALGPFGNLGIPELAVLVILAILAVFMLVRRLREGARKTAAPLQPKTGQLIESEDSLSRRPQVFQSSSERTPTAPDESHQELKEGIAWK